MQRRRGIGCDFRSEAIAGVYGAAVRIGLHGVFYSSLAILDQRSQRNCVYALQSPSTRQFSAEYLSGFVTEV